MRDGNRAEKAQKTRENLKYLPGLAIHPNVSITPDIQAAVARASLVFITVPSASFAEVCDSIRNIADEKAVFVSGTKGISPNGFKLMSEITAETLHTSNVGVLSGPNLAEEIARVIGYNNIKRQQIHLDAENIKGINKIQSIERNFNIRQT